MTTRKALQILIHHAAENQAGTGCGIRSIPSDKRRDELCEAVLKVWPKAYNYPFGGNDAYNLALPWTPSPEKPLDNGPEMRYR